MLKGRTQKYLVWRACERFKLRPPNTPAAWDDIESEPLVAELLAYEQIRQLEEGESGVK